MQQISNIVLAAASLLACAAKSPQEAAVKPESTATFDHTHAAWTEVLKQHSGDDGFAYKELKADRAKLDLYLKSLEAVTANEFESWTREQEYAFWINAYNAYTVQRVIDSYPIASIKDIGSLFTSVWDQKFIPLKALHPEGKDEKLSLNDIEHKILRPRFKDARVHAAINCASRGCPPLAKAAFVPEKLDAELDAQAKLWLADATRNRFDKSANKLELSQIFDWFKEDFVRDAGSVQAWVAKYAPPEAGAWIASAKSVKTSFLDYSWKLNEAKPAAKASAAK